MLGKQLWELKYRKRSYRFLIFICDFCTRKRKMKPFSPSFGLYFSLLIPSEMEIQQRRDICTHYQKHSIAKDSRKFEAHSHIIQQMNFFYRVIANLCHRREDSSWFPSHQSEFKNALFSPISLLKDQTILPESLAFYAHDYAITLTYYWSFHFLIHF